MLLPNQGTLRGRLSTVDLLIEVNYFVTKQNIFNIASKILVSGKKSTVLRPSPFSKASLAKPFTTNLKQYLR
jgi:hypothetical protein